MITAQSRLPLKLRATLISSQNVSILVNVLSRKFAINCNLHWSRRQLKNSEAEFIYTLICAKLYGYKNHMPTTPLFSYLWPKLTSAQISWKLLFLLYVWLAVYLLLQRTPPTSTVHGDLIDLFFLRCFIQTERSNNLRDIMVASAANNSSWMIPSCILRPASRMQKNYSWVIVMVNHILESCLQWQIYLLS